MRSLSTLDQPLLIALLMSTVSLSDRGWCKAQDLELKRANVVQRLRHAESLVESMSAEYTEIRYPTPESQKRLIEEACALKGEPNPSRYFYTQRRARRISWVRDGIKERSWVVSEGAPPELTAFDGHFVRGLAGNRGFLQTPEGAHYTDNNRIVPQTFLYQYVDKYYSDIVERGRECHVKKSMLGQDPVTEVFVRDPDEPDTLAFQMYFDGALRLKERQIIRRMGGKSEQRERLWERHVLSEYRRYEHESGEPIWFPHRVTYHYYCGTSSAGISVEYHKTEVVVQEVAFNVEMDPNDFVINFPRGTEVWDDLIQKKLIITE